MVRNYVILLALLASSLFACLVQSNTIQRPESSGKTDNSLFPLSIIHINDLHARFDEINNQTHHCHPGPTDYCFGGYARIVTTVRRLLRERAATNPIFLNAGDSFQGTFWYIVGRWNVTAQFLNMLPADAMTIGNHEFAHEVKGLVPFLKAVNSPIVVANMDASNEPDMQNLFQKSVIIDKYNRKIGVIGLILSHVDKLARTGNLKFEDEIKTVRREAELLHQQGVDIIVVLSHCGLDIDIVIAENAGPLVDVIVGGHTHTFMYNGTDYPGPRPPHETYPMVIDQPDGHRVLIVQAFAFSEYVGDLTLYFDDEGKVVEWTGNPVFLSRSIVKDEEIEAELIPWRHRIDAEGRRVVGESRVHMDRSACFRVECSLGNLVADAATAAFVLEGSEGGPWTSVAVAMVHVGLMRVPINIGNITMGDVMTLLPYENTFDYMQLNGSAIVEILEHAVTRSWSEIEFVGPDRLQFSGLIVVYNTTAEIGHRVHKVEILCHDCKDRVFEPLELERMYPVIAPSFLLTGGNGFVQFAKHMQNHRIGPKDIDTFYDYVTQFSPLTTVPSGRISFVR